MLKRMTAMLLTMLFFSTTISLTLAEDFKELKVGTYEVNASLSCYVNAMGGVEFGAPLMTSAKVTIGNDGSKRMTLYFTKSNVTIYSVSCDTFIDVNPSYVTDNNGVKSGSLGYYNAAGVLVTDGVTYTLSEDTAQNARQEQVHYVDSMTFPLTEQSSTYQLSLYVNSNVMGTQFTMDGYPAVLTVDWSQVNAEQAQQGNAVGTERVPEKNGSASAGNDSAQESVAGNDSEVGQDASATGANKSEGVGNSETVEKKKSLNIYPAQESLEKQETKKTEEITGEAIKKEEITGEATKTEETKNEENATKSNTTAEEKNENKATQGAYAASIQKPVLVAASATAGGMMLAGILLLVLGRREKKKCEN